MGTLNETQGKNLLSWDPVSLTGKSQIWLRTVMPPLSGLASFLPLFILCDLFHLNISLLSFIHWQMSPVRTDHRQTQPGAQPLEKNIRMWVDGTRHRSSFEMCEVRKEAGGLLSTVVFAFLSSLQGTWINHSSESERPRWLAALPGVLHNLSHSVLSMDHLVDVIDSFYTWRNWKLREVMCLIQGHKAFSWWI